MRKIFQENSHYMTLFLTLFHLLTSHGHIYTLHASCEVQKNQDTIAFSEYEGEPLIWDVRTTGMKEEPGPNIFSSNNVYVDEDCRLHLKITEQNGHWICSEVFTQRSFGYGEYKFYLESNLYDLDPNVVLGAFTYDETNCKEMYSEIDIESTRWGEKSDFVLHFTVQPVWMDPTGKCMEDKDNEKYKERSHEEPLRGSTSEHRFRWLRDNVFFESYRTDNYLTIPTVHDWLFPEAYDKRFGFCKDCGTSNSILIPKPGIDTRVHLNLWLHEGNPPMNKQEDDIEVIISKFEYSHIYEIEEDEKKKVPDAVKFYKPCKKRVLFNGEEVKNIRPLPESDFTETYMSKDDILYLLNCGYELQREVTGKEDTCYIHNLDSILIAVDEGLEEGFVARWEYDPPIIGCAPQTSFIGNDGLPSFAPLFHEMGHIFSLNAKGRFGNYLGEVNSCASNFLTETTACIYASYTLHNLIFFYRSYGIPETLNDQLNIQFLKERDRQEDGHTLYVQGFEYCNVLKQPPNTFYNILHAGGCTPSCQEGGVDNRALYTQQAGDYEYLTMVQRPGEYGLHNYMEIIRDIKDEAEVDILNYHDEDEGLAEANAHRASLFAAAVARALGNREPEEVKQTYLEIGFPIDDVLFEYYYNNRMDSTFKHCHTVYRIFITNDISDCTDSYIVEVKASGTSDWIDVTYTCTPENPLFVARGINQEIICKGEYSVLPPQTDGPHEVRISWCEGTGGFQYGPQDEDFSNCPDK